MKWLARLVLLASWAGVGLSVVSRGRFLHWVVEDLAHTALVLTSPLLLLALVDLYRREKEDDELSLKGVTVEFDGSKEEILSVYEHSEDVLAVYARLKIKNNSPAAVSPQVSSAWIERKRGRSWEPLPARLGPGCSPYTLDRFRTPSHEVQRGDFRFHTCLPGGASSHAGEALRLVVELDIPGQKNALAKHDFTVPPASPAPPTASGQAAPSSRESSG